MRRLSAVGRYLALDFRGQIELLAISQVQIFAQNFVLASQSEFSDIYDFFGWVAADGLLRHGVSLFEIRSRDRGLFPILNYFQGAGIASTPSRLLVPLRQVFAGAYTFMQL